MADIKERRNPRRFTGDQVEAQQSLALRLWLGGVPHQVIAEQLSADDYGWGELSVMTIRRRIKQGLKEMEPHDEWKEYAARQLAEIEAARSKVNQAIFAWRPSEENNQLAAAISSLVRLQEREAKIVSGGEGFAELLADSRTNDVLFAETETRTSVQRIMLDPVAFPAALAALEEVEALVESKEAD